MSNEVMDGQRYRELLKKQNNSTRKFEKEFLIDNRIKDLENIYRKVYNA